MQQRTVGAALERHVARPDPRVLRELLGRRVRDPPFLAAGRVEHVQLGRRHILRSDRRQRPAIRRQVWSVDAGQRRHLGHRPTRLRHAVDLPLLFVLLRREEQHFVRLRRDHQRRRVRLADDAPLERGQPLRRPSRQRQRVDAVAPVEIRDEQHPLAVALPLRVPVRARPRVALIVIQLADGRAVGVGQIQPAMHDVFRGLIDQQLPAVTGPLVAGEAPIEAVGEREPVQPAVRDRVDREEAIEVVVTREVAAHGRDLGLRPEVVRNADLADARAVFEGQRDMAAVGRPFVGGDPGIEHAERAAGHGPDGGLGEPRDRHLLAGLQIAEPQIAVLQKRQNVCRPARRRSLRDGPPRGPSWVRPAPSAPICSSRPW